jgi:hypothetical protein
MRGVIAFVLLTAACSTSSSTSSSSSGTAGDGGTNVDTCRPNGGLCACTSGCGSGTKAPASMQCPQPPANSGACGQECCLPATDGGSFACGSATCNSGEFCTKTTGGAELPDGGARESDACEPIPDPCLSNRTCACIKTNARQCGTICTDDGAGHVTLTCQAP